MLRLILTINTNKGLFTVMPANKWLEQSKRRPIPKMLFGEFWFEGENDKGQDASQIYRQMTKEGDELEAKDPENPLCYIRAALANRDVLVDIIRNTPRLIEIEHNGKRIAISENASDKTKQEMTRFLK